MVYGGSILEPFLLAPTTEMRNESGTEVRLGSADGSIENS